jgi:hypothetical protein
LNLHPYQGARRFEHFGDPPGVPHVRQRYSLDFSGSKTYGFNSLGFRGEELDRSSACKIFIVGCSFTFGVGLNLEETWGHLFKQRVAAHRGLDPSRVNLLNFSEAGGSNDFISRLALTQARAVRPDLLVAAFTETSRIEGYLDSRTAAQLGPWWTTLEKVLESVPTIPEDQRALGLQVVDLAKRYYLFYHDDFGLQNAIRNMLLLQFFCQSQQLPYLICWTSHALLEDVALREHPMVGPLLALLDRNHVCDFAVTDAAIRCDTAADGSHPGPQSNRSFSELLFKRYVDVLG